MQLFGYLTEYSAHEVFHFPFAVRLVYKGVIGHKGQHQAIGRRAAETALFFNKQNAAPHARGGNGGTHSGKAASGHYNIIMLHNFSD